MKKISISLSLILLIAVTGYSQKNLFAVSWEVNIPNNSDYLNKTSLAGGKFDYRYFVKKNLSVGLALNWATYEQHIPRTTFQKPDGSAAVTTDFVAQVYQLPITATAHYYLKETKRLMPYVGIALGGQYLEQSLYYNVYVSDNNNWGFVARPEIGTVIHLSETNKTWGLLLAASYSFATNKNELINTDSFKNLGISIGLAFHD